MAENFTAEDFREEFASYKAVADGQLNPGSRQSHAYQRLSDMLAFAATLVEQRDKALRITSLPLDANAKSMWKRLLDVSDILRGQL